MIKKILIILLITYFGVNDVAAQDRFIYNAVQRISENKFTEAQDYLKRAERKPNIIPMINFAYYLYFKNQDNHSFELDSALKYLSLAENDYHLINQEDKQKYCEKIAFCKDSLVIYKSKIASLAYQRAFKGNTISHYLHYVNVYGNFPEMVNVSHKIDSIYFHEAQEKNTVDAYQAYLKSNYSSVNRKKAISHIQSLKFDSIKLINSKLSYQKFIDEYPEAPQVKLALSIIDDLSWEMAKKSNTIDAYNGYLKEYKEGKYISIASEEIHNLEFSEAQVKNTIEDYEKFISKYPSSKFKEIIIQAINKINETNLGYKFLKPSSKSKTLTEIRNTAAIENKYNNSLTRFYWESEYVTNDYGDTVGINYNRVSIEEWYGCGEGGSTKTISVGSFFRRSATGLMEQGYPNYYFVKSLNDTLHVFSDTYFKKEEGRNNSERNNGVYYLIDFRPYSNADLRILKEGDESLLATEILYNQNPSRETYKKMILKIKRDDKYSIETIDGEVIVMPEYDDVEPVELNESGTKIFWKIHKKERYDKTLYGLLNGKGELIFNPTFDELNLDYYNFKNTNGISTIKYKGLYGLINDRLEIVLEPIFNDYKFLQNGFVALRNGTWRLFNLKSKTYRPEAYDEIELEFYNSKIYLKFRPAKSYYWGLFDPSFKILINPVDKFSFIGSIGEDKVVTVKYFIDSPRVTSRASMYIISLNNGSRILLNPELSNSISALGAFSEGLAPFKSRLNDKYGFINAAGIVVIRPEFETVSQFYNGRSNVSKFGTSFYINKKGARVNE